MMRCAHEEKYSRIVNRSHHITSHHKADGESIQYTVEEAKVELSRVALKENAQQSQLRNCWDARRLTIDFTL